MIVEFKVSGRTKREIQADADEVLARFFGGDPPESVTLHIRVTPVVQEFQDIHPSIWEAEVRAEV